MSLGTMGSPTTYELPLRVICPATSAEFVIKYNRVRVSFGQARVRGAALRTVVPLYVGFASPRCPCGAAWIRVVAT